MHYKTRGESAEPLWAGRSEQDTDEHAVVTVPPGPPGTPPPTRVCRDCAAQAQTDGAFCPYCGAAYARNKRFTKGVKIALAIALTLLIAGGATAGVLVKKHHDDQVAAAKHTRQVAEQEKRDAAAAQATEKKREADLERDSRAETVKSLEGSVTKDAKDDATTGLIDGPVLKSRCEPAGGTNLDDLSVDTGEFTCLAVTTINDDGTMSGYRYTANVNFNDGTYTWHFGG
jgi:hypothetical protein